MTDLDILATAVGKLEPKDRGSRWTHLSLCLIDAVFSINARYSTTTRTAHAYATAAALPEPLLPAHRAREVIGTEREEPLSQLLERIEAQGVESWAADELGNRQRTSTRSGVLKAEAVRRHANVLSNAGVQRLDDVDALLADVDRRADVERDLSRIPGHGAHRVRLGYLWMLVGNDFEVKPDRMVIDWVSDVLDRPVGAEEARRLLVDVAGRLNLTPWAIDHAVWLDQQQERQSGDNNDLDPTGEEPEQPDDQDDQDDQDDVND